MAEMRPTERAPHAKRRRFLPKWNIFVMVVGYATLAFGLAYGIVQLLVLINPIVG